VYDYNRKSTERLEALKLHKMQRMRTIARQWGELTWGFEEMNKLQDELRHINAVLHARYSTLPLWGDK